MVPAFVKWHDENRVLRTESDCKQPRIISRLEEIEGVRGIEIISQDLPSLDRHYQFTFDLHRLESLRFYPLVSTHQFFGYSQCDHLKDGVIYEAVTPVVLTTKARNGNTSMGLKLLCADCDKRIEHICSEFYVRRDGMVYRSLHNHDQILIKSLLKKHDIQFQETGQSTYIDGRAIEIILPTWNALLTDKKKKELKDITDKIKPSILISPGQKKDIINFLGLDCNVILFDDASDAVERFVVFDKERTIEQDEEKCCQHMVQNLERYIDEERGKEHDRIIESLARIRRAGLRISKRSTN